jgi:hypothetical protein
MALSIVEAIGRIKASVSKCLTAESIERVSRDCGYCWRQREVGPVQTVWTFLTQILHGNTACAHAVRLAALSCSTEAYCQARARLPLLVYQRLLEQTSCAARLTCCLPTWHGHRTFLVDGSTFSMPDTPGLQAQFGQPGRQLAGCGFPVAHWLTLFDAHSGLLIKQFTAPLRTHDMAQVAQLHPELGEEDILVGDTAFASYVHLALLRQRNLHGVFRAHQRQLISFRRDRKLVGPLPAGTVAELSNARLIRKLGKYDQLVEYSKPPQIPRWMDEKTFQSLPNRLIVRELRFPTKQKGGRTRFITLVTTLLDPDEYPAEEVAALYGQRWQIETHLGQLKTTMGMDVLHCRSVSGVLKEATMFALAYNLVRLVMVEAARHQQTTVRSISFIDALRWLAHACWRIPRLRLAINPSRRGRYEPRVKKRRPKQFDLMNQPRRQLRQRLLTARFKA